MIVSHIVCEINEQSTAEAVAQTVVNKICRDHQDQFIESNGKICKEREDMTLLVRLFSANLRKKSTPVTPPMSVSVSSNLHLGSRKSPDVIPVSIPFDESPKKSEMIQAKLPKLVIPSQKLRLGTTQSSSQPNSRVSTPVTLMRTAATPPVAFYRNLSQVSEGSKISTPTSPTNSTSTTSSLTWQSPASTSPRSASPWAKTVKAVPGPLTVEVENSQSSDADEGSDMLVVAEKTLNALKLESLEDGDDGNETVEEEDEEEEPEEAEEAPPSDGKVDPYIDFTEFIKKINEAGGEEVVFAEFMHP